MQVAGFHGDFAVLDGEGSLSVVGTDGKLAAALRHATRSLPAQHGAAQITMFPAVSESSTRVYYLDGDSQVRELAADGTTASVTTVPGSASAQAVFAVTPDDTRIAVSVIDYSNATPSLRLYVEDLKGGAHHVELFTSTTTYVVPVGWHDGDLVLGVSQATFGQGGPAATLNPFDAGSYHVVSAATADRQATVCGPGHGGAIGLIGPGGSMCGTLGGGEIVQAFNGTTNSTAFSSGTDACYQMSPSALAIACTPGQIGPAPDVVILGANGSVMHPKLSGSPQGWIDDQHLLLAGEGAAWVYDLQNQQRATVDHSVTEILMVGRIPGGL
jgi:hypothetical protein